jgi:23S rRNA (uracil1939-C5)-methyltransferase
MKTAPPTPTCIQLNLDKPVYGGDCLARLANPDSKPGKTVFVPLTLPGEAVTARITEDKRSFLKAELEEVLTPSPHRVKPNCEHFGICGGCHYQHADYPAQLQIKQQILRETLSRAGVTVPTEVATLAAEPWEYRNRIRLALTPNGQIAYRGRRSHDLIPIRHCPIAAPLLLHAARQIQAFLAENNPNFAISELELFTNLDESQLQITLFTQKPPDRTVQSWLTTLQGELPPGTALRLAHDDGGLTPHILAHAGEPSLLYQAANFPYRVDHGAFFQVNRHLIDSFVKLVTSGQSGNLAWDLYAGVGLFARALSANFAEVVAVESAPASTAALRQNLNETAGTAIAATTLDYLRRNREQREPRPDLIVLDPPRAGLGDEVTTLLNAIGAPRIHYVSCDPTTLARDLRAVTLERYRIAKITLVDMFPQTYHLETVVELSRS